MRGVLHVPWLVSGPVRILICLSVQMWGLWAAVYSLLSEEESNSELET